MRNLKLKNIIIGILIAVMSIACFAVVGITMEGVPKYEKEQAIHIAGLEFVDGWNLISDADDYYLMCENTSTGRNQGAKYRLTNDITINPYMAKQDVFIGATLDGAGHQIITDMNAKPPVTAVEYQQAETSQAVQPEYVEGEKAGGVPYNGITFESGKSLGDGKYIYGKSFLSSKAGTSSNSVVNKAEHLGSSFAVDENNNLYILSFTQYKSTPSEMVEVDLGNQTGDNKWDIGIADSLNGFAFGYYGYISNACITSMHITYRGRLEIDANKLGTSEDYHVYIGGVAGYAYNSTIQGCIVKFEKASYIALTGNHEGADRCLDYICGKQYLDSECYTKYKYNNGALMKNLAIVGYIDLYNEGNIYYQKDNESTIEFATLNSGHIIDQEDASDANTFESLEGMGVIPNGSSIEENTGKKVATTLKDVYNKYAYWALVSGVNNGEIIQTAYVDDYIHRINFKYEAGDSFFGSGYVENLTLGTKEKSILEEEAIGILPQLYREGYKFEGWSTTEGGSNDVTKDTVPTGDVTYYPVFTIREYTYKFDANGGTVSPSEMTVTVEDMQTSYFPTPTRTGYKFDGWYLDNVKVSRPNTGHEFVNYLTARWTEEEYKIEYETNEGMWASGYTSPQSYKYGAKTDLPKEENIIRNGYKFLGWYENELLTIGPIESIPQNSTGDKKFYARWQNLIDVTLNYNYKEDPLGDYRTEKFENLYYGGKYKDLNQYKPGFEFLGWTTDYLNIGSFIWWYNGGGGVHDWLEQPTVTNDGWLCSGGPMFWDSSTTMYYGYPIYLKKGVYELSAITYSEFRLDNNINEYCPGGKLSLGVVNYNGSVTVGEYTYETFLSSGEGAINLNPSNMNASDAKTKRQTTRFVVTKDTQFCMYVSYWMGTAVYCKDIRVTKLDATDEQVELLKNITAEDVLNQRIEDLNIKPAKYQALYNYSNMVPTKYDSTSDIGIPYDHTLYANWSDELNIIEFKMGSGTIVSVLQCDDGSDGVEFKGDKYFDLGNRYMFKDKIYISLDAYMDNWSMLGKRRLVSCAEEGGWCLGGSDDGNYLTFAIQIGNNPSSYTTVKYSLSNLSSGWHKISAKYDGSNVKLFIDNKEVDSINIFGSIYYRYQNSIFIGAEASMTAGLPWPKDDYFVGKMKNIYIGNVPIVESYYHDARIDFDGETKVGIGSQYVFTSSFYISFMAYMDDWNNLGNNQFIATEGSSSYGWRLGGNNDKICFVVYSKDGGQVTIESKKKLSDFLDKTWYKFKVVYSNNNVYFYVHEELQNSEGTKLNGGINYYQNQNGSYSGINIGSGNDGKYFKGSLSKIYISQGSGDYFEIYNMKDISTSNFQRFPSLVNTGKEGYKFLGWRLSGDTDLEGKLLGDTIRFYNGDGFKTYTNGVYDGQLLLGFKPSESYGYALLMPVYQQDDSSGDLADDWETDENYPPDDPGPDETGIPQPPPDTNIASFTIELQYGEDANIIDYTTNNEAKFDGKYIVYRDEHDTFNLPDVSQVLKYGHTFTGWKVIKSDYSEWNTAEYKPTKVPRGTNVNATLEATWTENVYQVVINPNIPGASDTDIEKIKVKNIYGYNEANTSINLSLHTLFGTDEDGKLKLDYVDDVLGYNIYNIKGEDGKTYRFVGWAIKDYLDINYTDIKEYLPAGSPTDEIINDKVKDGNNDDQLEENWGGTIVRENRIWKDGVTVRRLIHGYSTESKATEGYNVYIYAVWTPVYSVTIDANIGTGEAHKCGHVGTACTCGIYVGGNRLTTENTPITSYTISQTESGENNKGVSQKITTQSYFCGYETYDQPLEHVFGLPKTSDVTYKGFGLHYFGHEIIGWEVRKTDTTKQERYVLKYKTNSDGSLYVKEDGKPELVENGVSCWALIDKDTEIKQHTQYGDVYYFIADGEYIYFTYTTPNKINLQYLEDDITIKPKWRGVIFDVVFKTGQNEGYKSNDSQISKIQFGAEYTTLQQGVPQKEKKDADGKIIYENNPTLNNLYATNILGYTVIYAHPYNNGGVDEDVIITTFANGNVWDYVLDYKTYENQGTNKYPYGNKFYINIEGYYAPDLYKVKLNLEIPYDGTNNFKVNKNGFDLETNIVNANLHNRYCMSQLDRDGTYESTKYNEYQHKLFNVGNEYYIYLLQDQIVGYGEAGAYVEDKYINGKAIDRNGDPRNTLLPTFEIDYYEMQYYYTLSSSNAINQYQTTELDQYHKDLAQEKLTAKYGSQDATIIFTNGEDWMYEYNRSNNIETGDDCSTMYIYWYRNILNLDIYNILHENGKEQGVNQTTVGYVLITEKENVTTETGLQDHKQYHLVIYAYNGEQLSYVVYEFDDIDLLRKDEDDENSLYKYIKLLSKENDYLTLAELKNATLAEGVRIVEINDINNNGKYIPIYFGNSVVIEAVDQSKDYSLDEFIGYKFKDFKYSAEDKNKQPLTRVEINETLNSHSVIIDLRNYEFGKDFTDDATDNPNTSNYFLDQDVLVVEAHFEPIKYVLNYTTVDTQFNYYPQAGEIELEYDGVKINNMPQDLVKSSKFKYYVNVDEINQLKSYINLNIGYEHLYWNIYAVQYSSEAQVIKQDYNQQFNFLLNADLLRLYYNNTNYPITDEQNLYVYAVCQLMEFKVVVEVRDSSNNEVIREYDYESEKVNPTNTLLFTTTSPMILNGEYILDMLNLDDVKDSFVTYYQDGQAYILRQMYIQPINNPNPHRDANWYFEISKDLGYCNLSLHADILKYTIRYNNGVEVVQDNRCLKFVVDVAPVINIDFTVNTNSVDPLLGNRTLNIDEHLIAEGVDGEEVKIITQSDGVTYRYVGYWGERILLSFKADSKYYQQINFDIITIDTEGQSVLEQRNIQTNSNQFYTLNGNATITMEIVPKTYELNAVIMYELNEYSISQYANVKNESGVSIFHVDENPILPGVIITAGIDNKGSGNVYYFNDTITLKYRLNPALAKDFEVMVYCNNSYLAMDMKDGVSEKLIMFKGSNLNIEIWVQAKPNAVYITTNMPNLFVAQIQASTNAGQNWTTIQSATQGPNSSVYLVNGQKLMIRVKECTGFKFNKNYTYSTNYYTLNVTNFDGWLMFMLFDEGFDSSKLGTYILNFTQIPFEVEFKYWLIEPEIKELEGDALPEGYFATANTEVMQLGSEVILNQGEDKVGYGFDGYTYMANKKDESSKNLGLIEIDETTQMFVLNSDILSTLSNDNIQTVDDKEYIALVIYVNYIRQYTFEINSQESVVEIFAENGEKIDHTKYYNHGTEFKISVRAKDTDHYQIDAIVNNDMINNTNKSNVISQINTNLGNLSGFEIEYVLDSGCKIETSVLAEKYTINLNQQLYNSIDSSNESPKELSTETPNEDWFKLSENIYYKVAGDFSYNTAVEVQIFVANSKVNQTTYYVLDTITINGQQINLGTANVSTVDSKDGVIYSANYNIVGGLLSDESTAIAKMDVKFKALYYVTLQ